MRTRSQTCAAKELKNKKQDVSLQNNLPSTEAAGPPAKQPKLIVGTDRSGTGGNENATGENVNRSFEKIMGLVQMDIPRFVKIFGEDNAGRVLELEKELKTTKKELAETKSELAATKKQLAENIEHSKVAIAHLAPLIDRDSRMYSEQSTSNSSGTSHGQ